MSEQFQCRFCPHSYTKVLEFLDHFETHMNQNEQQNESNHDNAEQNHNESTISSSSIEKTLKNSQGTLG